MNIGIASCDEMNTFLAQVVVALCEVYAVEVAEHLVQDYYVKYTDPVYCKSIGIPCQDDDFMFHEGVRGMALRVNYYLGIAGDPDPHRFIEWRSTL